MLTPAVERISELPNTSPEEAWAHATDPDGINYEMRPLARMTIPSRVRGRDLHEMPIGTPIGRCWVLLFGFIPVDYDDLCLVELEAEGPRRRFQEDSKLATLHPWQHERVVEPLEGAEGARVIDRLGFEVRPALRWIPGVERLARAIIGAFFTHRHRRMRERDAEARS
jgi:hypothetical protein